jgi:hypothetical protein
MKKRNFVIALPGWVAVCATTLCGCGGGERMQTGTHVEVTDTLQREAEASSRFMDEQAKASRTAKPRKNIDAVEPGNP